MRWEDVPEFIDEPQREIDKFPYPSNELWVRVLTLARNFGFPWASLGGLDYSSAPEDRTPTSIVARLMGETELGRQITRIVDENEKDILDRPLTSHWPSEIRKKYVSLCNEIRQGINEAQYNTRQGYWEYLVRNSNVYWKVGNNGELYFSYRIINSGKDICVDLGASNELGEASCTVKWEFGDYSSIPREDISAAKERVTALFNGLVNETDFKVELDKILPE